MNSRAAARDENVERACTFVSRAAEAGAALIVLPEFFNCEYFPQYRDYKYMDYAETEGGFDDHAYAGSGAETPGLARFHDLRDGPPGTLL